MGSISFKPSLIFVNIRVGSNEGDHYDKLQPCLQILDEGGGEWQNTLAYFNMATVRAIKSFIVQALKVY